MEIGTDFGSFPFLGEITPPVNLAKIVTFLIFGKFWAALKPTISPTAVECL